MNINFEDYSASQRYHMMTQTIIPRPIAWALTDSSSEVQVETKQEMNQNSGNTSNEQSTNLNLAPFSYFTAVSSEPAILMLSVGKKPNGDLKDTVVNTLKNKKIVIHIANERHAAMVTETAATLDHGESELTHLSEKNTLSTVPFEGFELPRLAECDIAYGCELLETKELGNTPQTLLFVEIKQLYLSDNVAQLDPNERLKVYADKVAPLARLGANEYAGISEPFKVNRPS